MVFRLKVLTIYKQYCTYIWQKKGKKVSQYCWYTLSWKRKYTLCQGFKYQDKNENNLVYKVLQVK